MGKVNMKLSITLLLVLASAGVLAAFAAPTPAPKSPAPVVDIRWFDKEHIDLLVGGKVKGEWQPSEFMSPHLKGGEKYRLYSLTKYLGEASGSKSRQLGEDHGRFHEAYAVTITSVPAKPQEIIAIGGNWNALPRVPKVIDTRNSEYRKVVKDFLRKKGIPDPKVTITRILQVDLEGDGVQEVLICADNPRPDKLIPSLPEELEDRKGDYSFVLLRKLVKGEVKTIEVAGCAYTKKDGPCQMEVSLPAVLDVNGDGKLELLVRGEFWEGEWLIVHELNGEKISEAFGIGMSL
jgi:hypothetical protein